MPEISTGHRHHFGEAMSKYTAEGIREFRKGNRAYHLKDVLEAFEDLLGERESAKAAVTDEIVRIASDARYVAITGDSPAPPNRCEESDAAMRAALEAVAPMLARGRGLRGDANALLTGKMLASARVPDETGWLIESTFGASSPSWWTGIPEGCGQSFTTDANKAVRFCRKWDAEAVAKHMRRVIVTEHKWLAAAPKPTNVWPVDAREKAFSLAREMLQKGSAKPETEE